MRGPSKSPPKYRKHRASGQAIVTLDGKDIYLGSHGTKTSKSEYDRLIGEWLANGRSLPDPNKSALSVSQVCAVYLRFAKGYYVKNGKVTDELASIKVAIKFLRTSYGKTPAADFGPLALQAIQQKMIDANHSRGYLNKNIQRIRRLFKWAASRELVPVSVHQSLATVPDLRKGKTAARETNRILPVDDATVQKTIKHAPQVIADMIQFQRLTGCRPGELIIMRPCDIDRSGEVWQYVPESHKSEHHGRHRIILIGPKAQKILTKYLLRESTDVCFRTPRGKRFRRNYYHRWIAKACDKAKVEQWAPNRLRHATATEIRAKFGLEASQTVLGHASADVTQIYAERDLAKAAKIIREVG